MKIKRVCIKNFRSIKSLEFVPSDICALVGENNAGKSNILAALNFLLGETWPSRRGLDTSDYYNEITTRPIYIEVEFDPQNNPLNLQTILCRVPWDGERDGESGAKRVYFGNPREYSLNGETREQCALVYLDANRNLEYHLGYSRWKLFGRIVNQLNDDFIENASEAEHQAFRDHFDSVFELLKTSLYEDFEREFVTAFDEQIKRTTHTVVLDVHMFDPRNYYRSIRPLLIESGKPKDATEAGQGMRNLILLALFRTYAKVFKGDACIAIEEPEIYLHPHARRSLVVLFDEMVNKGNQVFYSTHSGDFVDVERFERILVVEKRPDSEGDLCTQVRAVKPHELLEKRRRLYPHTSMNVQGMRERYRNICGLEHSEAFFASRIVLVEGDTEEYALPIYAESLGYDFNTYGVSVVNAHGKGNLDQFYHLYTAFGFPVFLLFDNDRGTKRPRDLELNEILLRMLGQPSSREPEGVVSSHFAICEIDFENEMKSFLGSDQYSELKSKATETLGQSAGKGLIARYMARQLVSKNVVPDFIQRIIRAIRSLAVDATPEYDGFAPPPRDPDDIPF